MPPKSKATAQEPSATMHEDPNDESRLQELQDQLDQERRERQAVEERLRRLEQASTVPSVEQEPSATLDSSTRQQPPFQRTNTSPRGTPQSSRSVSSRIEKIPRLPVKLSDGITYRPRLWQQQILNHLEWYGQYFLNDEHKKSYIIDNTEGIARDFLEPLFLDPDGNCDPYDLIDSVCKFLTNPAEQSLARTEFKKLDMKAYKTFWEFYHVFRTTATLAGYRDDLTLRTELKDKLLPRLRMKLTQEWRRCHTLTEWVAAIQEEDAAWIEERMLHSTPASDKPPNRSGAYFSSHTVRSNPPAQEASIRDSYNLPSNPPWRIDNPPSKDRPNTPWRTDTPRQQTPSARHSSAPPNRHSTPHVNEIAMDDTLEESYEDAVEHLDADKLEAPCPQAKDDA